MENRGLDLDDGYSFPREQPKKKQADPQDARQLAITQNMRMLSNVT